MDGKTHLGQRLLSEHTRRVTCICSQLSRQQIQEHPGAAKRNIFRFSKGCLQFDGAKV